MKVIAAINLKTDLLQHVLRLVSWLVYSILQSRHEEFTFNSAQKE